MKNRIWFVLALLMTAFVAIQTVRAMNKGYEPLQDFNSRWEYGTLTVSTASGEPVVYWYEGDDRGLEAKGRNAFSVLSGRIGGNGQIQNVYQLVDQLGKQGWDLVSVSGTGLPPNSLDTSVSGVWTFKRSGR